MGSEMCIRDRLKLHHGVMPDILCVDAEGMDQEIIGAVLELETRPKVICVETLGYTDKAGEGIRNNGLIDTLIAGGYTVLGDTDLNTVFIDFGAL